MTPTDRLLDGSRTAGVYRIEDPAATSAGALTAAGWRVAVVPPSPDLAGFYAGLRRALGLPDWFGDNLDALWDSLGELTAPTALLLPDWTVLATSDPADWRRLLAVLRDRCDRPPAFAVVLA